MEYDSLFEPGIHDIDLNNINEIFVYPFENSDHRKILVERFNAFLSKLSEVEVDFEIWIDGSFSTKKPEPADIDIVVFYTPDTINSLPEPQKAILNYLFTDNPATKLRYKCDAYFIPNNIHERSYWRGLFGFDRNEKPKGIPRISID